MREGGRISAADGPCGQDNDMVSATGNEGGIVVLYISRYCGVSAIGFGGGGQKGCIGVAFGCVGRRH